MVEYPKNTVWYIEARPWKGSMGAQNGQDPVECEQSGSGVVIKFLKKQGEAWEPRSYILTCAHVVRRKSDDALYEDIVCHPPGKGYVKTDSRTCETDDQLAKAAKVSDLSPCKAVPGSRNEGERRNPASDWVLLEIKNPLFNNEPAICSYERYEHQRNISVGRWIRQVLRHWMGYSIIGYPNGAASWSEQDLVMPKIAKGFRLNPEAKSGMLVLEGGEESRKGMSGGGIFDYEGVLVGIHRSSTDKMMERGAIRAESIVRWLWEHHRMEFLSPPVPPRPPVKWRILKWSAISAAFLIAFYFIIFPPGPTKPRISNISFNNALSMMKRVNEVKLSEADQIKSLYNTINNCWVEWEAIASKSVDSSTLILEPVLPDKPHVQSSFPYSTRVRVELAPNPKDPSLSDNQKAMVDDFLKSFKTDLEKDLIKKDQRYLVTVKGLISEDGRNLQEILMKDAVIQNVAIKHNYYVSEEAPRFETVVKKLAEFRKDRWKADKADFEETYAGLRPFRVKWTAVYVGAEEGRDGPIVKIRPADYVKGNEFHKKFEAAGIQPYAQFMLKPNWKDAIPNDKKLVAGQLLPEGWYFEGTIEEVLNVGISLRNSKLVLPPSP